MKKNRLKKEEQDELRLIIKRGKALQSEDLGTEVLRFCNELDIKTNEKIISLQKRKFILFVIAISLCVAGSGTILEPIQIEAFIWVVFFIILTISAYILTEYQIKRILRERSEKVHQIIEFYNQEM